MKHFVYILLTYHKKKFYTYVGSTLNLSKRLKLHNLSKGAKYTKGKKWSIIYSKACLSKSDALKNEYKLKKNRKVRNKIKFNYIKKNYENFYFATI
ncbi:MAG: GIY-YIG nuclease family protein [Candidatus Pelagibacter sp.]